MSPGSTGSGQTGDKSVASPVPDNARMNEIGHIIQAWEARHEEPHALATLVRSHGSSYRQPGARMLIAPDGATAGSLSGGCLEDEVAQRAREVIRTGAPALMEFDTRRRFGCHGRIEIFIEVVRAEFLEEVRNCLERRQSCRAATSFLGDAFTLGSRLLAAGEETPAGSFVQTIEPPIHLLVFGSGPDSAPFRALADVLGWSVAEFEQATELPATIDARTAAIVKSHNYGRDCAALRHLLPLGLRYIGLLGPRQRRDEIVGDLLDSGVALHTDLFAPAGFDLGAETPAEIALAVVAEIQATFAAASGEALRERKAPIHGWNIAPPPPCKTSPV